MVLNSMKGEKNIALLNETAEQLELHTDYHRLKRVILNLLTNALKYTIEGFISVKGELSGDVVTVVVKDSGLGMEKESLNKLFKEFNSNVENKTEATRSVMNKEGIGLGLVTSLNLVEKLGPFRRIQVESEKGKGSRFSFQIFQEIDYKTIGKGSKAGRTGKQPNTKKKFTSIFDRIFESEEMGKVRTPPVGDNITTQISLLHPPVTDHKLKPMGQDSSNQMSSSLGTSSAGKKKLHIFIFESVEEVLEVRALLEEYFSQFKSEVSLSFEYGDTVETSIAKIIKLEKENQIVFDLVYSGINNQSSAETLGDPVVLAKQLAEYYKGVGRPIPSFFLVNNSLVPSAQLSQSWSANPGSVPADLFFDVFDGVPTEAIFFKAMARWHKFVLKAAKKL